MQHHQHAHSLAQDTELLSSPMQLTQTQDQGDGRNKFCTDGYAVVGLLSLDLSTDHWFYALTGVIQIFKFFCKKKHLSIVSCVIKRPVNDTVSINCCFFLQHVPDTTSTRETFFSYLVKFLNAATKQRLILNPLTKTKYIYIYLFIGTRNILYT